MPDAYADSDPLRVLAVVLVLTDAAVMYIDYDNVDGYDAARQNPLALTDFESTYLDGAPGCDGVKPSVETTQQTVPLGGLDDAAALDDD